MILFKDIPIGTRFLSPLAEDICHYSTTFGEIDFVFIKTSDTRSRCMCCAAVYDNGTSEVYPILEQYDVSQD